MREGALSCYLHRSEDSGRKHPPDTQSKCFLKFDFAVLFKRILCLCFLNLHSSKTLKKLSLPVSLFQFKTRQEQCDATLQSMSIGIVMDLLSCI